MTVLANQLRSLAEIAGEANTNTDPQTLEAYAIDGRAPGVVVRPSSAEEMAEILRFCLATRVAVVPAGEGTKLRVGATPERYDVALVMTRLDKVVAYDPGDLTVSVEAGTRLRVITELLKQNRQLLPLAAPFLERATVGGTVASGVDSPLRQLYGATRDFLLGVEFVTGDGIRAKSGGRVVKNVAGYDLHKLFIGSLGTLGVITRLNFKTFPTPEANGGFLAWFANESAALEMARKIRHSPLRPATLEIVDPLLAQLIGQLKNSDAAQRALPNDLPSRSGWMVAVGFGGNQAALGRYESELGKTAADAGALGSELLPEEICGPLWQRIREALPLLLSESPAATIIRVSSLPSHMGEVFKAAQSCGQRNSLPVAILARGVGVMYVAFLPRESGVETTEILARAAGEIADAAVAAQGFSFVAWCPSDLKSRAPLWGKQRNDWPLMRKVKQAFDPEAVLSPGRFLGGL
jgi:glycolate oxidase FAD binding subunit